MMPVPPLVIEVAIEPKAQRDWDKLQAILVDLAEGDPLFQFSVDEESRQTIIKGAHEAHLELVVDRLRQEHGIEANVGAPQVAYRETITRVVEQDYTHAKLAGGVGEFARVKIRFEPLSSESGFHFENAIGGHAIPAELVAGVEQGLQEAKESGVIAGFPVIDFKATLIDGVYHEQDSSRETFDLAAQGCFRRAMPRAQPKLLEPMMLLVVLTPEDCIGAVLGDLTGERHGQVRAMDTRGNTCAINAIVPLANMFGYTNALAKLCQGAPQYTMSFDHYEQVPRAVPPDDEPFPPAVGMRA